MEALPITPTKANTQTAPAPVSGGLGELFQALLQENTLRLDSQASILPSASATREAFEPGPDAGRGPRPSAAVEPEARARGADTRPSHDDAEPVASPQPAGYEDEQDEANDAPETPSEPVTAANDDADSETAPANGGSADSEAQTADEGASPAPDAGPETEETAVTGLPGPAQDIAANIAAGKAQALGKDSFIAQQALLRMAPQAQAATSANPAATTAPVGPNGAAARVQVTPAGLVAPPNAALGGGAALTAMTAETSQAGLANQAAQAGDSAATTALNNAASSVAAAQNALRSAIRATGAGAASNTGTAQSQEAQSVTTPSAPSAVGQASQAANIPAQASHDEGTTPHNAQTPISDSNNTNAKNGAMPDARVANMLGQNASGAMTPANEGVASDNQSNPQTSDSQARAAQPATPDQAQNATTRGPETASAAIAASQAENAAKAQNARAIGQPAPASAIQRAEGAAPQSTSLPGAATAGLGQAAARTPGTLPAQARPATAQPVPVDQVAVQINKAVRAGEDRIRIRLHPAELGQIDVKLKLGADSMVKAIVSVEKPETFELLQKDARGLERALQEAGLKTDSGSLSFHLRGENSNGQGDSQESGQFASEAEHQMDALADNTPPPAQIMSDTAIDIRV